MENYTQLVVMTDAHRELDELWCKEFSIRYKVPIKFAELVRTKPMKDGCCHWDLFFYIDPADTEIFLRIVNPKVWMKFYIWETMDHEIPIGDRYAKQILDKYKPTW